MLRTKDPNLFSALVLGLLLGMSPCHGSENASVSLPSTSEQTWNLHLQSTGILQSDPAFHAAYSGPNSLSAAGESKHTLSFDLFLGVRLWTGCEAHFDALAWQGFGLSNALGVVGFPNGEAFRLGTNRPDAIVARAFVRQTFALGVASEQVADDALNLAGQRAADRVTVTAGKFSAKDIFDLNSYAGDPRTQFMNWALMANEAWDYPADSIGFESGIAAEVNLGDSALRAGTFQMPRISNGMSVDPHLLKAWGTVIEFEQRFKVGGRRGSARVLGFLNEAHMGSYHSAVTAAARPADLNASRSYRAKHGFALNAEQEITDQLGLFARVGWNDGRTESWCFSDADRSASAGISLKGKAWGREVDTLSMAAATNGISEWHRRFLAAGGTGILAGDGALTYGTELVSEVFYNLRITQTLTAGLDCQHVVHPAFNRDRGPASVFGARLHWEY